MGGSGKKIRYGVKDEKEIREESREGKISIISKMNSLLLKDMREKETIIITNN